MTQSATVRALLAESIRTRLSNPAPSESFDDFVTDELGFDLAAFE